MPKQAEKMLEKVKSQLKSAHPNWGSKQIESRAYAIVQSYWKKEHGKPAF